MNLRIHFFPAICFPVSVYVTSKLSIETTWASHKIHARCLIKLKLAVSPFLKGFWKCRRCNYACLQRSRECSGKKKKTTKKQTKKKHVNPYKIAAEFIKSIIMVQWMQRMETCTLPFFSDIWASVFTNALQDDPGIFFCMVSQKWKTS